MNDETIIATETASADLWSQVSGIAATFWNVRGTGLEEELCAEIVREIPDEMLGHLLMQMLDPGSLNKHRWLTIAEVLGPDNAQQLYRAAVFCTKVA